jgi:hypothetical protein
VQKFNQIFCSLVQNLKEQPKLNNNLTNPGSEIYKGQEHSPEKSHAELGGPDWLSSQLCPVDVDSATPFIWQGVTEEKRANTRVRTGKIKNFASEMIDFERFVRKVYATLIR